MTTEYYRLRSPFTGVFPVVRGDHTHLQLWVNHANVGEIAVRNEELPAVLLAMCHDGPEVFDYGYEVADYSYDSDTKPDTVLVSERGEITTLAKLREKVEG